MAKPKYNIGDIVVYDSPINGKNLLKITNSFKPSWLPWARGNRIKLTSEQYYDGFMLEISKTNSDDIPLAPKIITGVTTIPEENLSPLETLY